MKAPRALLVDDNEDTVVSLAMLLELEGVQVRIALSAEAAMEVAASFQPHVAVVDIGLPDANGLALCRYLRDTLPRCHMVAFSGYAQSQDFQNSEAAGFDLHVAKPTNAIAALLALLSETNDAQAGNQFADAAPAQLVALLTVIPTRDRRVPGRGRPSGRDPPRC